MKESAMMFDDEDSATLPADEALPWKVLIADDDPDVHSVTRLVLKGVRYMGRPLAFLDAYSGEETLRVMQENPDTAVLFLDVIMESNDAGLRAVRLIREAGFSLVRIVLRTGFPGQAPERQVIVDYDIHDYKEKTELSAQKVFTALVSALRAHNDLLNIEHHRNGLMRVLESVSWFDFNAVSRYVSGMLVEFAALAGLDPAQIAIHARPVPGSENAGAMLPKLGFNTESEEGDAAAESGALVEETFRQRHGITGMNGATLFVSNQGFDVVATARVPDAFRQADTVLMQVFMNKVCQSLANYAAFTLIAAQRNAVFHALASRAECWDPQAERVLGELGRLATAVARRLQVTLSFPGEINDAMVRDIGMAGMMHDLGNDVLPDGLLAQPGAFTSEDRVVMQTHVAAGLTILARWEGFALPGAFGLVHAVIGGHHERYDGTGYPRGLCGDAIPLAARIVAVADAYAALCADRPHRPARDAASVAELLRAEAGAAYDPRVVSALLDVLAEMHND